MQEKFNTVYLADIIITEYIKLKKVLYKLLKMCYLDITFFITLIVFHSVHL